MKYSTLILIFTLLFVGKTMANNDNKLNIHQDYTEITQLIMKWGYYRDQGHWEKLSNTFHPEGTIAVTWYSGPFSGFVAASKKMTTADSGIKSKHSIDTPIIEVSSNKAVSVANVRILLRSPTAGLDLISYARFHDLLEKRDGEWKVVKRVAIYEKDRFDSILPSFGFWLKSLFMNFDNYDPAYQHIALLLEKAGLKLHEGIVVDFSPEAEQQYEEEKQWLTNQ